MITQGDYFHTKENRLFSFPIHISKCSNISNTNGAHLILETHPIFYYQEMERWCRWLRVLTSEKRVGWMFVVVEPEIEHHCEYYI